MPPEFEKLEPGMQRAVHAYVRDIMMDIGIELAALPVAPPPAPDPGTQADIERRVKEAVDAQIAELLAKAGTSQPAAVSDDDIDARLEALLARKLAEKDANADPANVE
jgi:hypothetical protein